MAEVTLSAALRSNLLSLQNTSALTAKTQLALSTGKKVNSALDNPQAFFASQTLTNNANDLSNLLNNIGQSIQLLQTANQGITSLTTLVQQAQSIATQAANEATGGALVTGSVAITPTGSADLTAVGGPHVTAGSTFSIGLGAGNPTTSFTITAGESLQTLVTQINGVSGLNASIVTNGANFNLRIQSTNGQSLIIADGVSGTAATLILGAGSGVGVGTTAPSAGGVPPDQISLQAQYSTVLTQIDQLVADTSYQGISLLNGNSQTVKFNATGTSSLTIAGVTFTSAGLGLVAPTGANAFDTVAHINANLSLVTTALATIRSQGSVYGNNLAVIQNRQDFTNNMVNTLKAGSDALTNADQNEEGANLLALQTQQQLGIQALSLASQANQSVLRLFQ